MADIAPGAFRAVIDDDVMTVSGTFVAGLWHYRAEYGVARSGLPANAHFFSYRELAEGEIRTRISGFAAESSGLRAAGATVTRVA